MGGSGSINGHLYVRGQAADYDMWAQLGCRGWSWSDVLPYFKRAESRIGGSDDVRGRAGPLSIEDQHDPHSLSHAFMAANEAAGLKRTPDYNGGDQEGTLLYQQMMRNGRRWSPVDAYLRPALGRPNLKVSPTPWSRRSTSRASAPSASPTARTGKAGNSAPAATSS